MSRSDEDTVYVFRAALVSPKLATFHARGLQTTQTKHTRCGKLVATWLPGQGQVWLAEDIHVLHAKAFAVPCGSCFRAVAAPEGASA